MRNPEEKAKRMLDDWKPRLRKSESNQHEISKCKKECEEMLKAVDLALTNIDYALESVEQTSREIKLVTSVVEKTDHTFNQLKHDFLDPMFFSSSLSSSASDGNHFKREIEGYCIRESLTTEEIHAWIKNINTKCSQDGVLQPAFYETAFWQDHLHQVIMLTADNLVTKVTDVKKEESSVKVKDLTQTAKTSS